MKKTQTVKFNSLKTLALVAAGSLATQLVSAQCAPKPPGLVAWYPGDGNAFDYAGTNHGTLYNGVQYAAGKVGQAFKFGGTNSVQVPDSPALRFGTNLPMTAEVWVYRLTASSPAHILGKRVGCSGTANSSTYQMAWDSRGVGFGQLSTGYSVPLNIWTHLAATYDGNTVTFYINGSPYAAAFGQTLGPANNAPFTIGYSGTCGNIAALIDEVSIYNRALSSVEVAAVYAAGSAGKCSSPLILAQPESQVGYWGKSVTLTVNAVGTAPLSYQWLYGSSPVIGGTNASLALTNLQLPDAGSYSVVITNSIGSVTSAPAILTVNPSGVSIALYAGVSIDGVVGQTYGVQSTLDLSNTNSWVGRTNLTLTNATQLWYDSQPATQPQTYYRVVPGPISVP